MLDSERTADYIYDAKYISNYDGDTIKLSLDCGLSIETTITVRLLGLDTFEIKSTNAIQKTAAVAAKQFVANVLSKATRIVVKTHKDQKREVWTLPRRDRLPDRRDMV